VEVCPVADPTSSRPVSQNLNGKLLRWMAAVASITIAATALPLLFALSRDGTAPDLFHLLKQSILYGLVALAVTIPAAGWLLGNKILRPLRDVSMAAAKVSDGNLDIWETHTELFELQAISGTMQNIATHIKTLIRNIAGTTKTLSEMAETISRNSRKMSRSASQEAEAMETAYASLDALNRSTQAIAKDTDSLFEAAERSSDSVAQMQNTNNEVDRHTQALSESVEETSSSIAEMTATIREISEGVEGLSESSEELVSTLAEMDVSVREVAKHANESVRTAERVAVDASESGMMSVADTISGMDAIQEAVAKSARIVKNLHGRSEDIGRMLTVIREVSEQTELLSLNASILAAQAGENGKGFSVVASEIKALADRTSESTKEIARVIKAVQRDATEAVEAIEEGKAKAERGKGLSMDAGDALKKILHSASHSTEMAQKIEQSAREQSKGISMVRETVEYINGMIDQLRQSMQNQRTGSTRIQNASEKINALTMQLKQAMAEQISGGGQSAETLDLVIGRVREIQEAVKTQENDSEQIVKAIDHIRRTTQDRVGISSELDASIRSMLEEQSQLQEMAAHYRLSAEAARRATAAPAHGDRVT
jgi:methyl-accepting chemotaxis protein